MLDTLDAPAVRTWCRLSLAALGQAREEIDALNVYPVPDGDTGTNLYLTVESAAEELDALFAAAGQGEVPSPAQALRAMAHGALLGARGNSGVILAQLLRGIAAAVGDAPADGPALGRALRRAADAGYEAVAKPVEGTVLTVAAAAAAAAEAAALADPAITLAAVAETAYQAARVALSRTPLQLEVLGRAGVVDAGGRGLVTVLGALADTVTGHTPMGPLALAGREPLAGLEPLAGPEPAAGREHLAGCPGEPAATGAHPPGAHVAVEGGPAYEVVYLLDAEDEALPALRRVLGGLGDSLVVVGGEGLWTVHVHVDDPGAAVEAGIEAGRPHRIRITHFATAAATAHPDADAPDGSRGVVSVVHGAGLAGLCTDAGATVLHADPDRPPSTTELASAIRRSHAREMVLLLNDAELRAAAGAAAEQLRKEGVRVAVIPTRSPVQGLAALAVHEPARRFDEDVVAMTSAAGATRHAELAVAEGESWTMAGVCQAGDVLGLIDGDVAVIGRETGQTAAVVLDRMLAAGGELVTLILGEGVPDEVADQLVAHVRRAHPVVDTVVYRGGQPLLPLLIGVE